MGTENFWGERDYNAFAHEGRFERQTRICKPKAWKGVKTIKEDNALNLVRKIDFSELNNRYTCVVAGNFIFGDFIENFITENNIHTEELYVATLSMNETNVDSFEILLNGGFVDKLNLIVSDYFYSYERRKLMPYMYKKLDIDNRFQLAVGDSHMKTVCFKTKGGKHIVIQGSANLRSSQCLEQFTIEDSPEEYAMFVQLNDKILEKYKTINHSIRTSHGQMWECINN